MTISINCGRGRLLACHFKLAPKKPRLVSFYSHESWSMFSRQNIHEQNRCYVPKYSRNIGSLFGVFDISKRFFCRLNYGGQKFTLVNGISNQHQQQLKANLITNDVDSQINTCSQESTKNERKEKLKLKNCFVCFVCVRNALIHIAIPIHVGESENFTTMCDTNKSDVVKCAICRLEAVLISNKFEFSKLPHCKLKLTMRHAKKQGVEYCRVVVFSFKNANRHLRLQLATLKFLMSLEIRQF